MITYLYVKTHNVTGLKYFEKTNRNPHTYRGSGKYWLRHLRKHGNDVSTIIIGEYSDVIELMVVTNKFSVDNDIVASPLWANLIRENGLDGAPPGNIVTVETRQKISKSLLGKLSPKSHYILKESSVTRRERVKAAQQDRIWITNGIVDKKIKQSLDIPIGWSRGRSNIENLHFIVGGNANGNNTRNKKIYNNGLVHRYFYPDEVPDGFFPGKMAGYQGGTGSHRKGKQCGKEKNKID